MRKLIKEITISITDEQVDDFMAWMKIRKGDAIERLTRLNAPHLKGAIINAAWQEYKDERHIV